MIKINIITQLLGFFVLAIIVNYLNISALLPIFAALLVAVLFNHRSQFLRSIKRFKWFFLVMLLLFAFNTPGEHLVSWPFALSPTYEGLLAGGTQTLRICVMLAALSLIIAANTRQQLISGFYFIFSPLKYLGLEVERFAARLWLTLHYVELQRDNHTSQNLFDRLKEMTNLQSNQIDEDVSIQFKMPQFGLIDFVLNALLIGFSISKVML
jgi:energy-coupling factor transporter transmembrane protein EcfT